MLRNILTLIRWQNLVFIAILMYVMHAWVATPILSAFHMGEQLPWWLLTLLTLATMLIAAGGYVINDYFDAKIDRINRPDQQIVTRFISKEQAMHIFIALTALGVVLGLVSALLTHSTVLAGIYILTPGLLWFYSASYKRQFIIGNLIIAFSSALVPLIIAIATVSLLPEGAQQSSVAYCLYLFLGGFAVFAFLTTWVREVVKDLQDQMGDRELECHTMPIRIGETWTKVFVTALILAIVAALIYLNYHVLPFEHTWNSLSTRYLFFGIIVPLGCELWLLWAARIPSDYKSAQMLMKFIMFLGVLYSFVILKLI